MRLHVTSSRPSQTQPATSTVSKSALSGVHDHTTPAVHVVQPGKAVPVPHGKPPAVWMAVPYVSIPDCPPGLEYLTLLDQLFVQQEVEMVEAFTSCETNNKYMIKNAMGQNLYHAEEDTDCLTRQCCGSLRPFELKVLDSSLNEVIHLHRPLRCQSCCCFCCLQKLEVTAPPGTVVGYVVQDFSLCVPKFSLQNAYRETLLRIEGPVCTSSCLGNVEFQVLSSDGKHQVGKISKQWTGLAKELFTDADNFGIQFPMDLDVSLKATLIATCFLVDFMFFESAGSGRG